MSKQLNASAPENEFSRIIDVTSIVGKPEVVQYVASTAECDALAERIGLAALKSFELKGRFKWADSNKTRLSFEGRIKASVVQNCIITLEPIKLAIDEPLDLYFSKQDSKKAEVELVFPDNMADEIIQDNQIDIGEQAVQHLIVNLDPYPRLAGADLAQTEWAEARDPVHKPNPFAALASLKADSEE